MRVRHSRKEQRRGVVLLLVLICIPLLALSGYAFTQTMRVEAQAANAAVSLSQAKWSANAGIEYARAMLADPNTFGDSGPNLADDSSRFCGQLIGDQTATSQLHFSLVHADAQLGEGLFYGMSNESAKIPLDNPAMLNRREALLGLPNMTDEIADAILDWIDADDQPKDLGAETDYYSMQSPPYSAANSAPKTLGELLLIKGVTPELLYGEDRNLNGKLDPSENDGDATWPPDNSDGVLDRGWIPYLTLHSSGSNLNPRGEAKVNLNGIVSASTSADSTGSGQATGGVQVTGGQSMPSINQELANQLVEAFGEEFVNFLIAYKTEKSQIRTISELIDATANAFPGMSGQGNGGNLPNQGMGGTQPIRSPWRSDNMGDYLEKAMEEYCTTDEPSVKGAIDILNAPKEVIRALPGIDEQMADTIATAGKNRSTRPTSPAFLLMEQTVSLEVFRQIEPYVTTQGRVYRVESVGYSSGGGPIARVEAIIDASGTVPKILSRRDLTPAGIGYTREEISGQAAP